MFSYVATFAVLQLFWFSCQYLPSDWLERPLLMKPLAVRGDYLHRDQVEGYVNIVLYCFV